MVDYHDYATPDAALAVATEDMVAVYFLDGAHKEVSALDRDAVAALVGQLSSWLRRTEAKP